MVDNAAMWARLRRPVVASRWLQALSVLGVLLVLRGLGLVADAPWWVLTIIVLTTGLLNQVALWRWSDDSGTAIWFRTAVLAASGTATMYVTGWGPMLVVGYAWILGDEVSRTGSRACRPALTCSLVALLLGQLAIQFDIAPTFVETPEVHGLAVLAALGLAYAVRTTAITTRAQEQAETDLRRSEERLRSLLANSSDVIIVLTPDGVASYVSPACEWILGRHPAGEFPLGGELVHPDDREKAREFVQGVLAEPESARWTEVRLRDERGDTHWFDVWATNRMDDPSVGGIVANLRDITERKLFEEQIAYQAYHDQLTGLPNRAAFLAQVQLVLDHPAKRASLLSVLLLDIDRFKLVNDSLSHELGDRLLVELGDRLRSSVRPGDYVARFGGDEFTILLTELQSPDEAVRVAERVSTALRSPLEIAGRELVATASIGITVARGGERDDVEAGDLLRQADLAMYLAKERGRARWEMFDPDDAPRVVERLELESALWRAVDDGELVIHYQPEIALENGAVVGVEALVRWDHPSRGLMYPEGFIPFAEESSLIAAIDRYVLREACRQVAAWERRGVTNTPLTVSVNLSPRFVNQPELVDDVVTVLRETGLEPERLQLEITERTALADRERTGEGLRELRDRRIRVAIDDFGTGYSSLSYLRHFPIDVLKLDKSFVDGIGTIESGAAIVEAVITMGHALGMRITAEGVERAEQASELRSLGCDGAQGYHFARPLAPSALEQLLSGDGGLGATVVPLERDRKRGTAS
ncbi:MAG: putative bifunctional diguanylate cyclase/phosphodiesterase [Acidimicrobiia bacterium]